VIMFERTRDPHLIQDAVGPYAADALGFDAQAIADSSIVLTNGSRSVAILEPTETKGLYAAHHFHPQHVRGREALHLSRDMLKHLWDNYPEVKAMRGFTPAKQREARWVARQLGFVSYGPITLRGREFEMYIMTRNDYERGLK